MPNDWNRLFVVACICVFRKRKWEGVCHLILLRLFLSQLCDVSVLRSIFCIAFLRDTPSYHISCICVHVSFFNDNQGKPRNNISIHYWTDTILDSKFCIQRLNFLCVFTILRLHINDILVPNAPPPLLKEESLEHSWLDDALPWAYKQLKLFSSLRVYEHYKLLSSFDEALRV